MKLARGTSWLVLAVVGVWAAPTPARRGTLLTQSLIGHDQIRVYDACIERRSNCLVARRDTNEPQLSTSTQTLSSTMTNSFASSPTSRGVSASSSTSAPLSSEARSTPSLAASNLFPFNNLAEQADSSQGSDDNHLRTVGVVGGFLAGIALVAIIGIIIILIRNQRLRGSSVASSFRSRTRTRSGTRPPVMAESSSDHVSRLPQLPLHPPLQIHTGDAVTAASHDPTTAATVGHQSSGMHQFPTTEAGSASTSSRTTSFGPHSPGTSPGGSNAPRRAPQIPSLGLSNSRHQTPTPTRTALDREEHAEQTEQAEPDRTETTEVTTSSTFGSQTLAATEDMVRSDGHTQTEETGMSGDIARTAETAHSGAVEASPDNQPKAS